MSSLSKPNSRKVMRGLKDFQRQTVDYVFSRLYGKNPVNRFLIADEVGLGKTLVAKGLIARTIDHLWGKANHRIDIIYICSNRDIAVQNVDRLNVSEREDIALASRLTLLPLHLRGMDSRLNFVSFTPGTSFDLGRKSGVLRERALLYRLLRDGWHLGNIAGPRNLLQGDAGKESWQYWIEEVNGSDVNQGLARKFLNLLEKQKARPKFDSLVQRFSHYRKHIPEEDRKARNQLIGDLRRLLATSCARALEPDLIIFDEFQRFKYLLEGDDEIAQLAQYLFNFPEAKVILLSATPYKMYTMTHERDEDDHYKDFLRTIKFLLGNDSAKVQAFEKDLETYRRALFNVDRKGVKELKAAKEVIESKLRQFMVRNERLAITVDRDGMVVDAPMDDCILRPQDIRSFSLVDKIAAHLRVADTVEYWRSAPYLLNFMDVVGTRCKTPPKHPE